MKANPFYFVIFNIRCEMTYIIKLKVRISSRALLIFFLYFNLEVSYENFKIVNLNINYII